MPLLQDLKTDLTVWEDYPYLWMEQLIVINRGLQLPGPRTGAGLWPVRKPAAQSKVSKGQN